MKLFVLRHGMTTESITDEGRELSAQGVVEVENVLARRLDDLRQVNAMYSSPLLRVQQTLNIAKRVLDFRGEILESQYLKTGSRLDEIKGFVAEIDFDGGILGQQSSVMFQYFSAMDDRRRPDDLEWQSAMY